MNQDEYNEIKKETIKKCFESMEKINEVYIQTLNAQVFIPEVLLACLLSPDSIKPNYVRTEERIQQILEVGRMSYHNAVVFLRDEIKIPTANLLACCQHHHPDLLMLY